jgi:hypothetical protein
MDCATQQSDRSGTAQVRIITLFDNQLLTYDQVHEYFGICRTELKEAKAAGILPFVPAGRRGVRFRVSVINRYILEKETRMQRGIRRIS